MKISVSVAVGALLLAGAACSILGPAKLTDAQEVIANLKVPHSDLKISGTADHRNRSYRPGEKITLSAKTSRPAYVAVLQVLRSGETTILFPNKYHPKALLPAHAVLTIPAPGERYAVRAAKEGPELFEFIASTNGQSWLFTDKPAGAADFVRLGATTRGFSKEILDEVKVRNGKPPGALQSLVIQVD